MTADGAGGRPAPVEAMLDPAFYPARPGAVELRETHISWVFLAGELAYKVKKPLALPFLDYSTLERRREMCRAEVELNRRLAPRIYLRVQAIVPERGGYALADEEAPDALEYVVEMRRVEEERSLAALARRGELGSAEVEVAARLLARFHAGAAVAPPERRGLDVLAATLAENAATLRAAGTGIVDPQRVEAAARFTDAFLAGRGAELAARGERGLVRDCHGDLRAEHVIVPASGEPYAYDCIEFNPELRQIDVAADLAFLVMDLTALGAEGAARQLLGVYREAGGELGDDALLSFFAAYRAWVRAKVDCLRAGELDLTDSERARAEGLARGKLALGHRFAWRARGPAALAVCGVAASGKSTLARELAQRSGWPLLSSDAVRKQLAGLVPTERGGAELYTPEAIEAAYAGLARRAREALDEHGGVIVDATFHRRTARAGLREALAGAAAPALFAECRAPKGVLLARAAERQGDPRAASDAGPEVVEMQLAAREGPDAEESAGEGWLELDATRDPAELAGEVEAWLDRRLAAPD